MTWDRDSLLKALGDGGWQPTTEREIDHGVQFEFPSGTKVNLYQTGKTNVQGKKNNERTAIERVVQSTSAQSTRGAPMTRTPVQPTATTRRPSTLKQVFIVYGHDTKAREALELLLLRHPAASIPTALVQPFLEFKW
jgi:predicted nucleotide-binding protein